MTVFREAVNYRHNDGVIRDRRKPCDEIDADLLPQLSVCPADVRVPMASLAESSSIDKLGMN